MVEGHGRPATAKRLRQSAVVPGTPAKTQTMKTVVCEQCGDRFAISHDINTPDPALANHQAAWLVEQFVWDHIQETKHRSSITLPTAEELKLAAMSRA